MTFHTLWTISSASLATVSYLPSLSPHSPLLDTHSPSLVAPVIALSHRLLAYASPPPPTSQSRRISSDSSTGSGGGQPHSSVSTSPFGTGLTQTELGNAAIKVGGSVLNGMKFLGGIALEAAKNRISEASGSTANLVGPGGRFFSRSAPTEGRVFESTPSPPHENEKDKVVTPSTNPVFESGYYATVVDLRPLLERSGEPVKVAEFMTSKSQPVARLAFSRDGCKLISVPENGQVTRAFYLRPRRQMNDDTTSGGSEGRKMGDGVRLYDLRRGRTSGVIEGLDSSRDGRWVAIGTRNRTVHVFPTNPNGGRPDLLGHLKGKVRNIDELQSSLVEVAPLVRLRPLKSKSGQSRASLAFVFLNSGDVNIPSSLLPHYHPKYPSTSSSPPHHLRHTPRNVQDILVFDPSDGMLSLCRITTDQRPRDHLPLGNLASVSTTAMGVVSRSLPGSVSSPVVKMSMSVSPGSVSRTSSNSTSTTGAHGGQGQQEVVMELVGRSEVMATWDLQRKRDWKEIRKVVDERVCEKAREIRGADWLSLAELSTCSWSPRILPRSIYLSHQFSFWTFGEDYHALLRQYHFDVRGSRVHVRREVKVNVGVGFNTASDRFVDDTLDFHPSPGDTGRLGGAGSTSTSFDEPLASALAGDLVMDYHTTYASSVPPILPMYPNGVPGSQQSAAALIRNSIPIRRLGDGATRMGGKLGSYYSSSRNRVLSGSPRKRGGGGDDHSISVSLEFDEEDEDFSGVDKDDVAGTRTVATDTDFVNLDVVAACGAGTSVGASTGTGISADSGSASGMTSGTSATSTGGIDIVLPPTPEEYIAEAGGDEDLWKGWESREVGQTVEEMERFDDISVVGFLDEEHQREKEAVRERERGAAAMAITSPSTRGKKKGKKGKGKR